MDLYSTLLQRFVLPAIAHFTDIKIWHEYKKNDEGREVESG